MILRITAIILLPLFSLAQSNYKAGYIVTSRGDTVNGFINYHEWDKNPRNIVFKKSLNAAGAENYSATNIGAFAVKGIEYYQRFFVRISQDGLDINKLAAKPDTTAIADTVFLQINTTGKNIALYKYTDDIKTRFYVIENSETQPQELAYHAYYNPAESSSVKYIERYRSQLEYLAQKYSMNNNQLEAEILAASYTEPDLIKIIQAINGPSSRQFTPKNAAGEGWFAGIGINYSTLKFTQAGGIGLSKQIVSNINSILPKIVAGIDFFPNKTTKQLLIRAELSLTANQYNIATTDAAATPQTTSTLNFKQYNSSVIPQIIYNLYNTEQTKVFIGAGASLNFSSYNHYQYITKYSGSFADNIQNNYPAFSQFWISFPLKAGLTINNKLEISVCYIPSSSITKDNVSPYANITAYQAGVNYLF